MFTRDGDSLSKNITIGNIYSPPKTVNNNLNAFRNEFTYIIYVFEAARYAAKESASPDEDR